MYSNYFPSHVSIVDLVLNSMSFRHKLMVYCCFFGKFLVKYEIAFFTRGNYIEGYIDTAYIDAIVTSFLFQFNHYHYSFTCDA